MMRASSIWYVMPFFKQVSFTYIGEKHYLELKKYFRIELVDETAFPFVQVFSRPLVLVHPYFYPLQRWEYRIARIQRIIHGLIGIDVADSDHISREAVRLSQYATAFIVPSNFARNSYIRSGIKKPVHVVPHGVNEEWLTHERKIPRTFTELAKLKHRRNLKLLLSFIVHSFYRKGGDILLEIYKRLVNERNDVLLVLKTAKGVGYFLETIEYKGGEIEYHMDGKVYEGWLTEEQMMELFDICDLYLLTSRGGGFEHPPLLGIARGLPCIGAKGCSWDDYMTDWMLVSSKKSDIVLKGNPIHDGYGVEMIIDKAVDRIHQILDNLEEYKAKTKEYALTYVRDNFTWTAVGKKLRDVVTKYL